MVRIAEELLSGNVLNIAHRGARSLAPENTLSAIRKAFGLGAEMCEVDLVLTKDNQPIVLHDLTLDRTSNARLVYPSRKPWLVHHFTLSEIRRLDFGSWFHHQDPFGQIAGGNVTPYELSGFEGEGVPTLADVLLESRANNRMLNLELKTLDDLPGHARFVEIVVDTVVRFEMTEIVLISSFHHDYLRQVKTMEPSITTGALMDHPFQDSPREFRERIADCYHPKVSGIEVDQIRKFKMSGIPVLVWVVNEISAMKSLINAGVSGIFTDFPQDLAGLLSQRARKTVS